MWSDCPTVCPDGDACPDAARGLRRLPQWVEAPAAHSAGVRAPAPSTHETIAFPSRTLPCTLWSRLPPPPGDGTPVTISGILSIPAGSGPMPAVAIMHGCSGINSSQVAWARQLNELGIATLMVQSFAGREAVNQPGSPARALRHATQNVCGPSRLLPHRLLHAAGERGTGHCRPDPHLPRSRRRLDSACAACNARNHF